MARLGLEAVSAGNTAPAGKDRTWDITLSCPNDVLVIGALSSAAWIMEWAYADGGDPVPDVDHTVAGLRGLVKSLPNRA